ncbi:hypothetical protein [Rhodobacter maris]|uniref:Uncharacterized protein n=1 Tax=Rhodobacter maris TaxID=446682 RepID=A0A285TC59_9RHOB|nr:hypothetical protein [Rhodobacter maris]SOC19739.1 hypothetical protein SAMN05877831_11848 [Rhodobacter maris]
MDIPGFDTLALVVLLYASLREALLRLRRIRAIRGTLLATKP